ncbi:ribosomal protein S5 domain 2-like protein [Coprinopsis marcescibilis]|uniref:Ribosomal RNA-processing protein 42 n=1 Tax=Coprinopsis marcescibilis TaxID=230819 RepID=A0A5C3KZH7_COPMA|nr:ribosomal protein S5 domain 2-like protein [Coprinopsis marcescibilis]
MASSHISKAESSYIQAGLTSKDPQRLDGRNLGDYRAVALETGVAPLANGSAKLNIGRNPHNGSGGTEVVAATKLEVETLEEGAVDKGRVVCTVTCSPAAYPHLSPNAVEDLQYDLTTVINQTLAHPSLHPGNLRIIPGRKSWLLNVDLVVLADAGNIYDALFMAARAALWDTKVPRTRFVQFKARKGGVDNVGKGGDGMDVHQDVTSGFDTRGAHSAADFELPDYWDEGEVLDGRDRWPICITLNLVPPNHFLDATTSEESAVPLKLLLVFSFASIEVPTIQAMRFIGTGETSSPELRQLIKEGQRYAADTFKALQSKLKAEDVRRNQKTRELFASR